MNSDHEAKQDYGPAANTDRELWHEKDDDYYAPSIHVTVDGRIGINVGGLVKVKTLREWHGADDAKPSTPACICNEDARQTGYMERADGMWKLTNPTCPVHGPSTPAAEETDVAFTLCLQCEGKGEVPSGSYDTDGRMYRMACESCQSTGYMMPAAAIVSMREELDKQNERVIDLESRLSAATARTEAAERERDEVMRVLNDERWRGGQKIVKLEDALAAAEADVHEARQLFHNACLLPRLSKREEGHLWAHEADCPKCQELFHQQRKAGEG